MLTVSLLFFFLIWTFFLAATSHSLHRLGETLSLDVFQEFPGRFYYYPVHQKLFKKKNFERLLFSASLAANLGRVGFSGCAVILSLMVKTPLVMVVLFLCFLGIILLFGDYLPRFLSLRFPEKTLAYCSWLASFFLLLSLPFTFFFVLLSQKERKKEEEKQVEEMRETIVEILQKAEVKSELDSSDKNLLESVLKFKERIVREVMVPRSDLFSLPAATTIRAATHELIEEGYSRVPIFRESIDNIVGVLMFKDTLKLFMDCESGKKERTLLDVPVENLTKRVFYVPETKLVSHLLQDFRTKQMHMAIVINEYGGTEGVVTIEDILEEIVGEIADEYDEGEEALYTTQPGAGCWIVDARMSIFDAEDNFGIHIPQEGEYDTISGYIFDKVGSIPPKGFRIEGPDFELEILSSTQRSVEKVKITPKEENS